MTQKSFKLAALLFFATLSSLAQDVPCIGLKAIRAYSVATTNSICLYWPTNFYRLEMQIGRRVYTNQPSAWQSWTNIYTNSSSPELASSYCDTNVTIGINYEYRLAALITNYPCDFRTVIPYWQYQYISTGTSVPLRDQRGNVILLVESSLVTPLSSSLYTLTNDLIGDGYKVFQHNIAATEVTNAGWFTAVTNTKALIVADYNTDTNANWNVFIVGHVPVPYSGLSSPGSHTENYGAHPSDWYYADIDESEWTDTTVSNVTANYYWTRNIPGDGKFDQRFVPSSPEMRIGRIDLRNMPAFGLTEAQLIARYLARDHAWRHKQTIPRDRGLIIDSGEAWDSFNPIASLFGSVTNTDLGPWLTDATNTTTSYFFASSKGSGDFTEDDQLGTTAEFAATKLYTVFPTMYGSYYGDWDSAMITNCVLLAPLSSDGYVLSTYYHEITMSPDSSSMGEAIGYELYAMAANIFLTTAKQYWAWIHIETGGPFLFLDNLQNYVSLLGDPTLRLRSVYPPTSVSVAADGMDNVVSWGPSVDTNLQGYHVYRAPNTNLNAFTRLTSGLTIASSYRDVGVIGGPYRYMVRAVKLESSSNRSYYNASQGVFAEAALCR